MNMVMNEPASRTTATRSTVTSSAHAENVGGTRADGKGKQGLNLRNRLSSSPEVYTGLNRHPFGE